MFHRGKTGTVILAAGLVALSFGTLSACKKSQIRRRDSYTDRVWRSDPYCRTDSFGCPDPGPSHDEIKEIRQRRWGRDMLPTVERPTSWSQEFRLPPWAERKIRLAHHQALRGELDLFYSLGFTPRDARSMRKFAMPEDESITRAAHFLRLDKQDLSDFLTLFLLRLKFAYATSSHDE